MVVHWSDKGIKAARRCLACDVASVAKDREVVRFERERLWDYRHVAAVRNLQVSELRDDWALDGDRRVHVRV